MMTFPISLAWAPPTLLGAALCFARPAHAADTPDRCWLPAGTEARTPPATQYPLGTRDALAAAVLVEVGEDGRARTTRLLRSTRVADADLLVMRTAEAWHYHCDGTRGGMAELQVAVPAPLCWVREASMELPVISAADEAASRPGLYEVRLRPQPGSVAAPIIEVDAPSASPGMRRALAAAAASRVDCTPQAPAAQPWIVHVGATQPGRASENALHGPDRLPALVEIDDGLMEFSSVADAAERLPHWPGVEVDIRLPPFEGVASYTTSIRTDLEQRRASTARMGSQSVFWTVTTSEDMGGPRVERSEQSVQLDPGSGQPRLRIRLSLLCEADAQTCEEDRQERQQRVERSRH